MGFATLLSKNAIFLIDPIYHWAAMIFLILVFQIFHRNGAVKLAFLLFLYFSLVVFSPVPRWMILNLEKSYSPIEEIDGGLPVVVLSGSTLKFNTRIEQYYWHSSADRLLVPMRKIIQTGATMYVTGRGMKSRADFLSEAQSMGQYAGEFQGNIIVEDEALSTRENAMRIKELLERDGVEGFYLSTSAFHMRRSMASFERLGMQPIAYPTDYKVFGYESSLFGSMGYRNIQLYRWAAHEYLGLVYYWALSLID